MQVLLLLSLLVSFTGRILAAEHLVLQEMVFCEPGKFTAFLADTDKSKALNFVNICMFTKPTDVFIESLISSQRNDLFFGFLNRVLGNNLLQEGFLDYSLEVMLQQGNTALLEDFFGDMDRIEEYKWTLLKAISKTGVSKYLYLIIEVFSSEEWDSPQMEECLHLAARLGLTLVPNQAIIKIWHDHSLIQEPVYEKNHLDVVRFLMANDFKVNRKFIKYRADASVFNEHEVGVPYQHFTSLICLGFFADYPFIRSPFFNEEEDFKRGMFADLMPKRNWVKMSRVVREMIDYAVGNDDILKMRLIIEHVPLKKLSEGFYLHRAIVDGSLKVTEMLINAGVDINAVNEFGNSPLDLAIQGFHNSEIISLLLKKNAVVDRLDEQGNNIALVHAIGCDDSLSLGKIIERCHEINLTSAKYHQLRREFTEVGDNPLSNEFNKDRLLLLERTVRGQVKRKEPSFAESRK